MNRVSLYACVLSTIVAPLAVAQASTPTSSPSSNPCPCPKAFQGFFLGANVGYAEGGGKNNRIFTIAGLSAASNNNLRVSGVDGGVNAGYTHRFGNVGVGLEFVANWANSQGKNTNTAFGQTIVEEERLRNSLQIRANLSYVICDLVAPKLIFGWDNSQWKRTFQTLSRQGRNNSFLWGAGVDFLVLKNVMAGVEYTRTTGGTLTLLAANPRIGASARSIFKPKYNKVSLVVKYIF